MTFDLEKLKTAACQILNEEIIDIKIASSGANSQIFKLSSLNKKQYALKLYPNDFDNRQRCEKDAIDFLNTNGFTNIPQFEGFDETNNISILQWINSSKLYPITKEDISASSHFISSVLLSSNMPNVENFSEAKQACLSGQEISKQIEIRREKLTDVAKNNNKLHTFLQSKLFPELNRLLSEGHTLCKKFNIDTENVLATEHRRLIPADFGFHNTLRQSDGSLIFIDFEYFGWDDPIKPAMDFTLHPSYLMSSEFKRIVINTISNTYNLDSNYLNRLICFSPFYTARWALIMMNKFLPNKRMRTVKDFQLGDICKVQETQIAKVEEYLSFQNINTFQN